jgi:hypothetical protein
MSDNKLLEPDDTNMNKTKDLTEIINNSILLFKLQTKFNDDISKKIDSKLEINSNLEDNILLKIIDKLLDKHVILPEINNKIDDYFLYNSIFSGISIILIGVICIYKK